MPVDIKLMDAQSLSLRILVRQGTNSGSTSTYDSSTRISTSLLLSTEKHYFIESRDIHLPVPKLKLQIEKSTDDKPFVPSYPMLISLEPLALAFSNENNIFVVKDASKFANN